jgi:hypothetical protein
MSQPEAVEASVAQLCAHAGMDWDSTPGTSTDVAANAKPSADRRTMMLARIGDLDSRHLCTSDLTDHLRRTVMLARMGGNGRLRVRYREALISLMHT